MQITMEFAEPPTGPAAAKRTAANPKVRHIRVAHLCSPPSRWPLRSLPPGHHPAPVAGH